MLTRTVSPQTAKALIDAGYIVRVEDPSDRIYKIDEFKAVGAEIVPAGSWVNAPKDHVILGLKEIDAIDADKVSFLGAVGNGVGKGGELQPAPGGGGGGAGEEPRKPGTMNPGLRLTCCWDG